MKYLIEDTCSLGELVRGVRLGMGLSRRELGDMCGLSESTIKRIEGSGLVTLDNFFAISKSLNLKIEIEWEN